MSDFEEIVRQFDDHFAVYSPLASAFEQPGEGCGHDLPLTGVVAIIAEWERIKTPEMVAALADLFPVVPPVDQNLALDLRDGSGVMALKFLSEQKASGAPFASVAVLLEERFTSEAVGEAKAWMGAAFDTLESAYEAMPVPDGNPGRKAEPGMGL